MLRAESRAKADPFTELGSLGYECLPSRGNFISFDCKEDSKDAFNKLLLEGVIVRSLTVYKMPNYLGSLWDFLKRIKSFLKNRISSIQMSVPKDFSNVLIIGLGLIGGSIAKKLKDISYSGVVHGLDNDSKATSIAKEKHLISSETLNLDNLDDLLVIFCTPVLSIQAALNSFKSLQPSQNVILTDTLSTKGFFNEMLRKEFPELKDKFVSSHPIAGSEKSGLIHSKRFV